jgi:hypothetical protein
MLKKLEEFVPITNNFGFDILCPEDIVMTCVFLNLTVL